MSTSNSQMSEFQQVLSHANRAYPYPLYRQLRSTPIRREDDGSYVVSSYDAVAFLLRDSRLSSDPEKSKRAGMKLSILNMDPPEHDRIRRIVMRCLLSPARQGGFAGMVPELRAIVTELIDRLVGRSEIDIVADVAYPFPVTVVTDLLGVPRTDEPKFRVWADAIVQATDRDPRDIGAASQGAQRAISELGGYLFQLTEARRSSPKDDLLSRLVHHTGPDGSLTPADMTPLAILLLLAGHETTVNLISNGMLTFLRHPDLLQSFKSNPELAGAFIEEALRYEPPVHITIRTALEDINVEGTLIPSGATVHLLLASANRDERRFADPDKFIATRSDNKHLAFGSGVHNCLGAPLARLEGQIALQELTRRLYNPRLLQDPPPYRLNPSLRGPKQIRVAVDGIEEGP
jgi:cytochrome P450